MSPEKKRELKLILIIFLVPTILALLYVQFFREPEKVPFFCQKSFTETYGTDDCMQYYNDQYNEMMDGPSPYDYRPL